MSSENHDPYEAAVAPLRAKEARLVAELDAVRKSLAAIEIAREAANWVSDANNGSRTSLTATTFLTPPAGRVFSEIQWIGPRTGLRKGCC